jgi:hypothetical protein
MYIVFTRQLWWASLSLILTCQAKSTRVTCKSRVFLSIYPGGRNVEMTMETCKKVLATRWERERESFYLNETTDWNVTVHPSLFNIHNMRILFTSSTVIHRNQCHFSCKMLMLERKKGSRWCLVHNVTLVHQKKNEAITITLATNSCLRNF